MNFNKIICIELFLYVFLYSQEITYRWPIRFSPQQIPTPQEKLITSTFGEYRPLYNNVYPHFHEGIDIPEGGADFEVYPITYRFYVDDIIPSGNGYIIELIHITNDGSAYLLEGSRYLHLLDINDSLEIGGEYTWDDPIHGWLARADMLGGNHLHLELRRPYAVPLSWANSINPFTIPELQINDDQSPIINYVYVDYSLYGNANVENWNFLKNDFSSYYGTVTGGGRTFVRLLIPAETPYNDWDDPHIIISGERKTRFIVRTYDIATNQIVGPYKVEMEVDLGISELSWEMDALSIYEVSFDSLINTYPEDKYEEEDIYHVEQPIPSGWGTEKYFRLYPHDEGNNGLPAPVIISNLLETENLEEGHHMIRIIVRDFNGNRKTGDFHIYIRRSEWVDYPRSF